MNKTAKIIVLSLLLSAMVHGDGIPAVPQAPSRSDLPVGPPAPERSEVFVVSSASLRERATESSRRLALLPAGSRLMLDDEDESYLRVEVPPGPSANGAATAGYLQRSSAAIFPPGEPGAAAMIAAASPFSRNPAMARLAAALLDRATALLHEHGKDDALAEVLLGEIGECDRSLPIDAGKAFERGLVTADRLGASAAPLRERAVAGIVRDQFRKPSETLVALWQETDAWLNVIASSHGAEALRPAADRLGRSALPLGRLLLASRRTRDLKTLDAHVEAAAALVAGAVPGSAGPRLASRARLLAAMAGDGTPSFPQAASVTIGDRVLSARIEGELGSLSLALGVRGGKNGLNPRRAAAVPILPVPGSLRISPDGRWATWLEVARPTAIVPVAAPLAGTDPAREIPLLAGARPLRDVARPNVLTSPVDFSRDGSRLGFASWAWDETAPDQPRLSIVSAETSEVSFDRPATPDNWRRYRRLLGFTAD